jgi:predicted DNA-binding protein (MmcQ/YjbR family)
VASKFEDVTSTCLSLRGAGFDYPFGPEVRVFRVGGKIFALLDADGSRISLKCDPALADVLRASFEGITPGYHLNKRHWNTVTLDGSVPDGQVRDLIEHSYELVLSSLPRKARAAIKERPV